MRDPRSVETACKGILDHFSHVDILVNNAGVAIRKPLPELSVEEWHTVIDTNLTGAFLMCKVLVPQMRGSSYGRVINIYSNQAHVSLPGRSAYAASKTGLLGLTRVLAL